MSVLITSDIHLTDKPRDEYRWGLFAWLKAQALQHDVKDILFLGDQTDAKDKHSSNLTNRLVESLVDLKESVNRIILLRGNHDYIDENTPFFKFINNIKGIQFITSGVAKNIPNNCMSYFVPNSKNFDKLERSQYQNCDYLFCHQTFQGAKGESGFEMDGIDPDMFDGWNGIVISGDIHYPQTMHDGRITYVGTPYPVRFNDEYECRVLLIDENNYFHDLHYPTLQRHTITISTPDELVATKLNAGDQIKVRLALDDLVNWEEYKEAIINHCKSNNIDLYQIEFMKKDASISLESQRSKLKFLTPKEIFEKFCDTMQIGEDTQKYGRRIVESNITND